MQIIFHVISRKIWSFFPSLWPLSYPIVVLDFLHLRKEKGIEEKYVQVWVWKLDLCWIFLLIFLLVETGIGEMVQAVAILTVQTVGLRKEVQVWLKGFKRAKLLISLFFLSSFIFCAGLPCKIFGRQDHQSSGHITNVPSLLPPHSISQILGMVALIYNQMNLPICNL